MSPKRTGTPSFALMTMARRSSKFLMLPSARTSSTSSPSPKRPAPSLRLLASIMSLKPRSVTPVAANFTASGITSKLRTTPPSALTSATPGTVRSAGRITQSRRLRLSAKLRFPPSTVNINISPNGVVIGAIPPLIPLGRSPMMPPRRSATCCLAQ